MSHVIKPYGASVIFCTATVSIHFVVKEKIHDGTLTKLSDCSCIQVIFYFSSVQYASLHGFIHCQVGAEYAKELKESIWPNIFDLKAAA